MPLLDHFRPPLSDEYGWPSVHGQWISELVQFLNDGVLPQGYYAKSNVRIGSQFEVDVGTDVAVWTPPRATLTAELDVEPPDVFEVLVLDRRLGSELVAAIELVSPANKDRPGQRAAFAEKCTTLLRDEIGVLIVDVVTALRANLHSPILERLGVGRVGSWTRDLYAVSYHVLGGRDQFRLDAWEAELVVGGPLPTLPLWLDDVLAVPVDLEVSYGTVLRGLRIAPDD